MTEELHIDIGHFDREIRPIQDRILKNTAKELKPVFDQNQERKKIGYSLADKILTEYHFLGANVILQTDKGNKSVLINTVIDEKKTTYIITSEKRLDEKGNETNNFKRKKNTETNQFIVCTNVKDRFDRYKKRPLNFFISTGIIKTDEKGEYILDKDKITEYKIEKEEQYQQKQLSK